MFCTVLNYICMRILGEGPDGGQDNACARARKWILDRGGVTHIPSWGKIWLSVCPFLQSFTSNYVGKNSIQVWINFSKYSGSTTTQEHKDLYRNSFSSKGKITEQILNNFTILNRDYNIYRYNLSKEKILFFFSLTALFLTVYLSQFSLTLYIFLFSFTCSHSRSSPRLHCPQSHSLGLLFTLLLQMTKWPFPFIFSPHSSFLLSTLFKLSHNKGKHTSLDFCTWYICRELTRIPNLWETKKIEKTHAKENNHTHKTIFTWFGNLPTSTEWQGFHYYQGIVQSAAIIFSFSQKHGNKTHDKTLITNLRFLHKTGQKNFPEGVAPGPSGGSFMSALAWAYRLKPPLHGLSLSKSPIKNHAILFGLG